MKAKPFLSLEQRQDVRSLAAFRILAGTYLIYDIISRLQHGRLSLLWYTSSGDSFLDPDDTPHRSPIHRFWFYRGSESFQICLFVLTFLLGTSFALGYKCNVLSKTLLWLNVVAMSCRCMPPHDGSDTYFRHLLLWSIQLPVSQVWSVDAYIASKRKSNENKEKVLCSTMALNPGGISRINFDIENRAAVWGMRLQIVIMYLGTVFHRTIDRFGVWKIHKSPWLPPQLTAVHFALNSSFSPRDCWLGDIVRTTLPLSQFMTLTAMIMETFAPIGCLVLNDDYIHISAFILWKLHFGLLVLMNLPNWQFVGMFANVIWVPSWVWDTAQRRLSNRFPNVFNPPVIPISTISLKKKDIVSNAYVDDLNHKDETSLSKHGKESKQSFRRRSLLSYFFLTYMLYDFAGNRGWITKVDNGDIGEFLRFSQFWVMFSGPPTKTGHVLATGTIDGQQNVNIWEWMKDDRKIEVVDLDSFESNPWTNMTHVYPSPRIERVFGDLIEDKKRIDHIMHSLCHVTPFTTIRFTAQKLSIMPPGSSERFSKKNPDSVYEIYC